LFQDKLLFRLKFERFCISTVLNSISVLNPAEVTSKHKHRCCPCPKWSHYVDSFTLD